MLQESLPKTESPSMIGYSDRIHDPAFASFMKSVYRWSGGVSIGLALLSFFGLIIFGRVTQAINPEFALFIGSVLAILFLSIGAYVYIRRKSSRTWDGVVIDKDTKEKHSRRNIGHDVEIDYFTEYTIKIKEDQTGKIHRLTKKKDHSAYRYFQIGDKVRHHAGLNSYEKYHKSKDVYQLCNACGAVCDLQDEICKRCKCPLLR